MIAFAHPFRFVDAKYHKNFDINKEDLMFGWFKRKKKNPVKDMIDKYGLEACALVLAGDIWERITDEKVAYQFVLEELDAARSGNDSAKAFALQSGIALDSYKNAMQRSWPAIDGPDGPQQRILQTCNMLREYPDLMVALRIAIVEATMSRYEMGKYQSRTDVFDIEKSFLEEEFLEDDVVFQVDSFNPQDEKLQQVVTRQTNLGMGAFADILGDLSNYKHKNPVMSLSLTMAHAYAVRFALAGGFLQRTIDGNSFAKFIETFKEVQLKTDHSVEFQNTAAEDALAFVKPYFATLEVSLYDLGNICHGAAKGILTPSLDSIGFYRNPEDIIQEARELAAQNGNRQ